MKIRKHTILVQNERLVVPQIQLILCKSVKKKKKYQSNRFLRKTRDPGAH